MEIPEIKQRLTLARVLQHYGLKPDKHQRLHCPFHEDKSPSMQVYYKTHTAYCFSSNCKTHGKSMDVIDFVLHKENTDKHTALLKCTEIINYYEGKVNHQQKPIEAKTEVIPMTIPREHFLQNMFTYFKNAVPNSQPAKNYLRTRGLDPLKIEVGYNTAQFHHGSRKDDTLINNCVAVGLLAPWGTNSRTGGQAFKPFAKYCIVFALRDKAGQVTGLYCRSTENNTDQKHYYLKDSRGLYPGYPEPETKKLIIAESIIDAASLLQIEAIAKEYSLLTAYGTNRLTQAMKSAIMGLKQLTEIVFAFDNDEAGNKAAAKYAEELKLLLPNIVVSKMSLPCKDVNETLTAHNEEVFTVLLNERVTDFSFSIEKEKSSSPETIIEPPQGGAKLTVEKKKLAEPPPDGWAGIQQHPANEPGCPAGKLDAGNPYKLKYASDTANYYIQGGLPKTNEHLKIMLVVENPQTNFKARNRIDLYEDKQVERLCKEIAEKLQLRKDLLEADVYRLTDLLEKHIETTLQQSRHEEGKPLQVLTIKERSELESFARKPKLVKRLNELIGQAGIVGEDRNRIFLLIIAISHKMPETLHALIQGSSGSGKTRLLKQISDCIPKENVTRLTRLSDKALYNFPEHYFVNHLLCLEDIDGLSEEAELSFRELQSNGELNSAISIKLDNGQMTGGQRRVRGPIASMACTTHGEVYEDNMSRVFLIAVDESTEQTKRIIEYQNCVAAGAINKEDEEKTRAFIRRFISILQPHKVVNPFASKMQLPEEAHKIRRLNDLFQNFVKMVTVLNQYQRKSDERKRLITEIEDIETAVHIMFESIILKVDELDGSLRQFYEQLKAFIAKKGRNYGFTRFEIREATGVGKTQQHHYINQLVTLEYVQQSGFANRGFTYKIAHWDNHGALRDKIKNHLTRQIEAVKTEHQRTPGRTPAPATAAG